MAKLTFVYGTMNAGKSLELISIHHNYTSLDKKVLLLKPSIDNRNGENIIKSRAFEKGLEAIQVKEEDKISDIYFNNDFDVILVDEVQFLTIKQIEDLFNIAKTWNIPVMCFGLRSDFQARLFPAVAKLFVLADEFREVRTLCSNCGTTLARFNLRYINDFPVFEGEQIKIGDSEYKAVCPECYLKIRRTYEFYAKRK